MSREMKDSGVEWIGEIPEDWEIIPNKHLMKKVKNLCPVYNGEDILSLSMKGVYVRDPNDESGKRPTTYNGYQHVQEGDLLMCLFDIDVTPRCVGRVYNDGLTSPAYSRFIMNKTRAIVDYYYYYYLALDFDKTLLHLSKNMRSSLTESDFGSINAPVPSPTEQQQIVHFLDRKCTAIDTAIEKTKKSIEKLEEYKKAVITKAVTKGIDPNAKMKDSGVEWIGEIPENWDTLSIKRNYRIVAGATPKSDKPENWDGEIPWITPSDYKTEDKYISSGKKSITEKGYNSCSTTMVPANSIIFSKRAPVGTVAISANELCTNQGCLSCVPLDKSNSVFGYYSMIAGKNAFEMPAQGTTFMEISADTFANMKLPYCDTTEQQQIVHFLDRKCTAIDTAIEKKKRAIEKWEEYKKSLIYYAVTGKIDCRNEVIE